MPPAGAADKKTEILEIDARNLQTDLVERAGQVIRDGGTCAFPTETVYGLGADGLNPDAVRKIFEAKGRPGDNPLILHIAYPEQIAPLTTDLAAGWRGPSGRDRLRWWSAGAGSFRIPFLPVSKPSRYAARPILWPMR